MCSRRSDVNLLAAAPSDADAFGEFYLRHVDAVAGYFWTRTRDREITADLTAETFAAALGDISRFDETRGEPAQWLFGIARYQLTQFWRRRKAASRARRRLEINTPPARDTGWEAIETVDARLDAKRLRNALGRVPKKNRAAVQLRVIDELDYTEIGIRLGCKPGAARVRVLRGLRQLMHEFDVIDQQDQQDERR